jgi:hypothetical protein
MGYAAGELAEGLHLLRLEKLLPCQFEGYLRITFLRYVAGDLGKADQGALLALIASMIAFTQNRVPSCAPASLPDS